MIPGYNTSCIELNDSYKLIPGTYNPYDRAHIINSIGNKIDENEENCNIWSDISHKLSSCEYREQIRVKNSKNDELKIFSLNVRSLVKSISHFREEIHEYQKYDVLSFNETNCTEEKLPNGKNDIVLEGFYEPLIQNPNRASGRGGGLALYVNKKVCSHEQIESFRPNYCTDDDSHGEFQFLKIHRCKGFNNTKLIINVYRSPSKSVEKFTNLLDSVLKSIERHSRKHTLITGDFNVDLIKYNNDMVSQNLVAVMEKYGFVQLVSRPTRVTDHSATLIDHAYTNDILNTTSCHVITANISDHLATVTTLYLGSGKNFRREKVSLEREQPPKFRKFNEACNAEFRSLIQDENWTDVFNEENADEQYNKFSETYTKIYNQAYPLKGSGPRRKNERKDPKPWILPWLEDTCARRQRLFYLKTVYPTAMNIAAFKKIDKFCDKRIDIAKKEYYKKFFEQHRYDSRKQWQMINGLLNRSVRNRESIKLKNEDGNIISRSSEVAAKFNEYFSSIASNIKTQISARLTFDPGGFQNFLQAPTSNSIYLSPVTPSEVQDVINKLKNKATLDTKIAPMKIANDDPKFTGAIAEIVNSSFQQGVFPTSLKIAKVVPIHKGGSKTDVTNYRPISLLSSFSKIFEKLMHIRILRFLDSNNSLFESQYGFRPGMSCEHAILNAQNTILQSLHKKQIALLLLLDYSKAFDVIEHPILLKKLEHYGIRGVALQWFQSYLSNRQQFVTIDGENSSKKAIDYGVPQGSILGPLLFVIYINDLPSISTLAKFILYADDANIIITGQSEEEIQSKLLQITSLLLKWVDSNGLSLNLKKTHFMVFSHQKVDYSKLNVTIAGTKIGRVSEARFLGVILDDKLSWSKHIAAVRTKMIRYIGIMYRIKRHLPLNVRLQMYHSFIQSHVNYCSLVWGFAAKHLIESIFSRQKQGIRMVMPGFVNYFYKDGKLPTHTKSSFKEYKVLTVHGIIVKNALTLMHRMKYFQDTVPLSIKNLFPKDLPTYDSDHISNSNWLEIYGSRDFRASIFFKGPLLAITEINKSITSPPSLFSINIYKSSAKRIILEQQSVDSEDEAWPVFLLFDIPGLRISNRCNPQNHQYCD